MGDEFLVDRQRRLGHLAVDVAGADVQEGTGETPRLKRLEQVQGAKEVDLQGPRRIAEGLRHVGLPGQVDDRIRQLRPEVAQRIRLQQVVTMRYGKERPRRVGRCQISLKMLAYETGEPGDEQTLSQGSGPFI